jgi:hypothetical protein
LVALADAGQNSFEQLTNEKIKLLTQDEVPSFEPGKT